MIKKDKKNKYHFVVPIILQKSIYGLLYPVFVFFTRLEIRGREHLTYLEAHQSGPLIIAANHTSELDVMILPFIFPFFSRYTSRFLPLYFVAQKKEKYHSFGWRKYIYGGIFFNILGAYPVHSGQKDYEYALSDHIEILRRHNTLVVFPEGKRTRDGSLSPARGGVGHLVHVTGAPVLPLSIDTFFGMTWKDFILRRRKVVITIGKKILAKDIIKGESPSVEDYKQGGEIIMGHICKHLQKK